MAQELQLTPSLRGQSVLESDLLSFCETDEWVALEIQMPPTISLLDVIWLWAVHGGGYARCGSYETLLLFVIHAADGFDPRDGGCLWGMQLRSQDDAAGRSVLRIGSSYELAEGWMSKRAVASLRHPLLERSEFELGSQVDAP